MRQGEEQDDEEGDRRCKGDEVLELPAGDTSVLAAPDTPENCARELR